MLLNIAIGLLLGTSIVGSALFLAIRPILKTDGAAASNVTGTVGGYDYGVDYGYASSEVTCGADGGHGCAGH